MADVTTFRPLIEMMAAERCSNSPSAFDDCVQEGLIAAWRVSVSRPSASNQYVTAASRRAIGDVLRGRPCFGAESHRGKQDAYDAAVPLTDYEGDAVDPEDPTAAAALRAADLAAHHAEVDAAVLRLSSEDRVVVVGRYWQDRPYAELAESLGVPAGTLSRRWVEVIRPRLREELAHLRTAA